jgi:hypothetical protein
MRRQLMPLLGGRYHGAGTVVKFGLLCEPGKGTMLTIMLHDVGLYVGSMVVVAQHCWVKVTSEIVDLNPCRGSRISFDATVEEYYKFTISGRELLDYSIGQLAGVDLVAGGEGLSLEEYLGNLRQSRTFASNHIEIPCIA